MSTGPPFLLADQNGNVVLLYFGYTFAGRLPTTLAFKPCATQLVYLADASLVLLTADPRVTHPSGWRSI